MFCVRGSEAHPCQLNFFKTPEMNSVSTKTDNFLILLIIHPKICQITKNWKRIGSKIFEFRLSGLLEQPNVEKFQFVHKENRMANVIRFSIETIQGMEIWKTSGYFFDRFSKKNYRFSLEAIQNHVSLIFLFCFVW